MLFVRNSIDDLAANLIYISSTAIPLSLASLSSSNTSLLPRADYFSSRIFVEDTERFTYLRFRFVSLQEDEILINFGVDSVLLNLLVAK